MNNIQKVREALEAARLALNMHEAWEGNLIMSELELDGIPAPTQSIWNDIVTHLQPHRASAFTEISAALALLDDLAKVDERAVEAAAGIIERNAYSLFKNGANVTPVTRAAITAYLAALTEAKR